MKPLVGVFAFIAGTIWIVCASTIVIFLFILFGIVVAAIAAAF